ncbi:transcription factor BHLH6-like [Lolium rigidum]|uniref:transcription factor BHLH6-like n=1 Tax=Lolium rigidum TaxID=89674 RepID=UPI001F5CEDFE|nr:transcription factor BHLH6-like [Lolium rigidum]
MDDFMQWAMNSLDQQQHHAVAPPAYGGTGGSGDGAGSSAGAGPAAFPSLQALRRQSTAAGGGFRDLTVQVDQHRASNSWSASSCDSPGAAAMDYDATAAAATGWSPHTARARTSRPMSWNFSAASAQTTEASLPCPAAAAAAAAAAARGGHSTPTAGRRGGGGTAASSSASASAGGPVQDHIIAERRRREKINQRFIELSTVIPGLKKMDKATILGDAVKYVRELQEKVKTLEDDDSAAATTTNIRSAVLVNKKKPCQGLAGDDDVGEQSHGGGGDGGLPEIEVRVSDEKSVLVRIHCKNARGLVVRVLAEVEALRLAITHTSVMPFPAATAIITITAKVEAGFNSTVDDIVRRLNSALHQHYGANSDQNTAKREC